MIPKNRSIKLSAIGLLVVCLLAVGLSVASIISTNQLRQSASQIYAHPYTVSNEARAMRANIWDMRNFLSTALTDSAWSLYDVQASLDERITQQYSFIEVITSQYLGPPEDTVRLKEAMKTMEQAHSEALPLLFDMEYTQKPDELRELYSGYDAVNDALTTIIDFADHKVEGLKSAAIETASRTIAALAMLTVFLPAYFIIMHSRESKSIREIRYREYLFDLLSRNIDDMFFIYNKRTEIMEYVSANTKRLLGIEEAYFRRNPQALQDLIPEEDQAVLEQFRQPGNMEHGKSVELRLRFPSGELHWVCIHIYPELIRGKATHYIAVISDQTETIRTQQTLRDALASAQNANAAKKNFLSRMSHEIRTPMNAIIGMTAIAGANIRDLMRVEDCLEKIGYASKHLMMLINDVLDMSRIDEGKMTIAHETFSLESVAESITSIICPQAAAKGLTFTMPLVGLTNTLLIGDSMRLNQILLNLLSNSLKFTPEGGAVRLEICQLQTKNGRVRLRLTVSDTGIGMNKAFMDRMFLPFEQENASIGQKYGGTGLGMAITKNLVTLMGGIISVRSEPEQGSSIIVELEFDLPEDAELSPRPRPQPLKSLNVMIADDDRDCCIHTALLLDNLGIRSDWVLNGQECVDRVLLAHNNGEDYDVCLIDWKMPDVDGVEVTRRVREVVGQDMTIIIITAYDWSAIEQKARDAGANAFLSKPIFASTLYNALCSATGSEKTADLTSSGEPMEYSALKNHRVLLAEDNEINREIAVEVLQMAGLEVDCAVDGRQAVDRFLSDKAGYDLILMDVQMPVMNGYEATETIRESCHPRAKTIPIIALTANAFQEDVSLAAKVGMDGHLAKPIEPKILYRLLEEKLTAAGSPVSAD